MKNFQIVNQELLPKKIIHIIWDVNGTITKGDMPDPEVLKMIISLARKRIHQSLKGIHQSFITGRDRAWLKMLVASLKEIADEEFNELNKTFYFYPELGLIQMNSKSEKTEISPLIKNHPITSPETRKKLAGLFYQSSNLKPCEKGKKIPAGFWVGGDSKGNFFLIPENSPPEILFPWFIWEEAKEAMASAAIIRDPDTFPNKECAKKINESIEELEEILRNWGLEKWIKVSPVSTALNLVPMVNGVPLDKDVSAGTALLNLSQKLEMDIHKVCSQTVAIGDGIADFLFSTPKIEGKEESLPFIFVGPESQYKPTVKQERNIIIKSKIPYFGPEVTLEVLKFLGGEG